MANYKKKGIGRTIAGILCGVLVVAAVAGSGTALYMGAKNNGWFDKEDEVEEETEESSIDNVEINEGVSTTNLSISSIRPSASLTAYGGGTSTGDSYTTAESYVLTAVYNEDATNPKFIWSSTDTAGAITLTPSDDTITCTVTCNSAFSTQITITCTAEDDASVTASCTVDYVKRMDTSSAILRLYYLCYVILIALPLVIVFYLLFNRLLRTQNNDYGKDSKPLKAFKKATRFYRPVKEWVKSFIDFIKEHGYYWIIWLLVWALNFNLLTIFVEFLAYYFYFCLSFDISSLYKQVYKLMIDLAAPITFIPWYIWLVIAFIVLEYISRKTAYSRRGVKTEVLQAV